MINATMHEYRYFTYQADDGYGQPSISPLPTGKIKMAINLASQNIQENINYKDCQYVGLTHAKVDDSFVIEYNKRRLKVLYVNNMGRLSQVYLAEV